MKPWRGVVCNQPCGSTAVACMNAGGCWVAAMETEQGKSEFVEAICQYEQEQIDAREPKRLIPVSVAEHQEGSRGS